MSREISRRTVREELGCPDSRKTLLANCLPLRLPRSEPDFGKMSNTRFGTMDRMIRHLKSTTLWLPASSRQAVG